MIAKVQGNIVDYLMPPLSAGELLLGVVMGGVTRGMLVGLVVWLGMLPFVAMQPAHLWAVLYFMVDGIAAAVASWASWRRSGPRSSTTWRR